eukprot:29740-Eustigmatos_ZCMA.PRE.1
MPECRAQAPSGSSSSSHGGSSRPCPSLQRVADDRREKEIDSGARKYPLCSIATQHGHISSLYHDPSAQPLTLISTMQ